MSPRAVLLKTGLKPFNNVRPVNTAHPKIAVHSAKSKIPFSKQAQSTAKRPFNKQIALTGRSVHAAKRHYYTGRPKAVNTAKSYTGQVNNVRVKGGKPQHDDKGFIDSGCSRHMTGNIAYLLDFKEFDEGYVAFGGGAYGGRITGKGTLKTNSLDFEDVYFVIELKFKLFSVSQMCDKKNYVLFTDIECLVLSSNFKLPDENQILLKIPRKDNMYSFDMKNIVPKESLTCLVAKATLDKSMPLAQKTWFTWVFFLTTKDETSEILKNFIKEIETLVDKKVKKIRSDNGTEFKNKVMDDFCREKGIKREYSVAMTPQQNGIAERRNRTLIEAARTIGFKLALSFMRPFGCHVTILNTLDSLGKFDGKSDEGTISNDSAGTSEEISQDCIVMPIWKDTSYFDSPTKDVDNGEPKTADDAQKQVEDGPNNENAEQDKFEDDSSTKDVNVASPKDMFTMGVSSTLEATHIESFSDEDEPETRRMTKPTSEQGFLSDVYEQKTHDTLNTCLYACFLSHIEPTSIAKALSSSSWVEAMHEELLQFKPQQVWILVDLPNGKKAIGTKWFFRNKKDERGIVIRNKARISLAIDFVEFNYSDVKSASTPVDLEKPLVKDRDVDVHLYRSMIGSLMYLITSRPDIMFAVCTCTRFQVTLKTSHLLAVKRIFRYLKGKPTLGLWYFRDSPFELVAYTDSDYAGATQDRKSTTGGCQFLGNRLISWQCKRQTVVSTSTTEVEYVVAASCCRQVLWIQNQLLDYGYNFINTVINIDNNNTICIIENPVQHSKTKHIEIRHHFIRDCNAKKLIQMVKIHTDYNVADLLTKGFDAGRFQYLVSKNYYCQAKVNAVEMTWALKLQLLSKFLSLEAFFEGRLLVGDVVVHKKLGDRMERAATTASSLEAKQDSGSVNAVKYMLMLPVQVPAAEVNPVIYTSCIEQFWATANVQTVNGVRQLQALVDKKRVIITESSIQRDLYLDDAEGTDCLPTATIFEEPARMRHEKPSQKLTFYKAFFSPQWKYFIHTITQCLSTKSTAWNEFSSTMASLIICLATNQKFNLSKYIFDALVKHLDGGVKFLMYPRFLQVFINQQLRDMSTHKKIVVNPFHTKKVFANMKRAGKDFSRKITALFDTMMVQASEKVEVPQDETEHEDSVPTPSNDLQPSGEDSMQLTDLMVLCTKLQTHVLDLEKVKDAQEKEIATLKKRVQRLERKKKSRPTGLKRLKKVDLDKDVDVTLVDESLERQDDELMFDTRVLDTDEMPVEAKVDKKDKQSTKLDDSTAGGELTTAATTTTTTRPKARGVVVQEPSEFRAPQEVQPLVAKDKGKGIMIEPEVPLKRKDQITLDEQIVRDIQAKLDAELIEEQKLARKQEEEANIALIESWENKQAMIEADRLLAERL
ncbi:putative ribonuclease H-like domain-containing protein [Tanacetum coccineum]|uniref:Ribonuclease H-like domain-containing protein n=1 Tax=Tanacetum coccineum TaxID=301880 RepID=A0ABQ5A871_9ASTR